jgi:endo-1,3-1,4-beta-glycanase ExoK
MSTFRFFCTDPGRAVFAFRDRASRSRDAKTMTRGTATVAAMPHSHDRAVALLSFLSCALGCASAPPAATPADAAGPSGGTFVLDWQDDLDTFDAARWELETFSWDGNLAQFSTANATFANGIASLALTPVPSDTAKPFRGVEMRSRSTLTYGKVESRIRFAKGSGVVSSLVLIYTPYPADDWNELDIEVLGRYSDRAQLNAQVYTGPPTQPPVQQSVTPTQYPMFATLPFDPSADFHVYAIEWTPTMARFTTDGQVVYAWSTEIARLKLPQNILLTIWASSAASWAGPILPDTAPTTADYDWVRVYRWVPAAP